MARVEAFKAVNKVTCERVPLQPHTRRASRAFRRQSRVCGGHLDRNRVGIVTTMTRLRLQQKLILSSFSSQIKRH